MSHQDYGHIQGWTGQQTYLGVLRTTLIATRSNQLGKLDKRIDSEVIHALFVAEQLLILYVGLSDFHYSTTHGKFMTNVRDTILSGKCK